MKHLLSSLFIFFFGASMFAQPTIQWQKAYGGSHYDVAKCVLQTTDGGYIVAGRSASSNGAFPENLGGEDVWVMKLDETGSVEWQKSFGGAANEEPNAIKQTPDGGYIIVGLTESNDEIMFGNHGEIDAWVVKMDSTGSIEWKRVMGGSLRDIFHDVVVTADGGYLLIGKTESSDGDIPGNQGSLDFWVVKLSGIGIVKWQKTARRVVFGIRYNSFGQGFFSQNGKAVVGNNGLRWPKEVG